MKEEKVVTKEYVINGFKHFSQLAMEYFPAHSGYSAARKSMRDKIDENLQLKSELEAANYTDHTITLSPKMQHLGILGTTLHFTTGKLPEYTELHTYRPPLKRENRTIYF